MWIALLVKIVSSGGNIKKKKKVFMRFGFRLVAWLDIGPVLNSGSPRAFTG